MRSSTATIVTFFTLAWFASVGAYAQGAYKWTDKNGRVQYSDQPPAGVNASRVESKIGSVSGPAASRSGPNTAGGAPPRTVAEQEQAFRKRQMERQEAEKKQARSEEQSKQRADACANARGRIASLDSGGRQVRFNEKGERSVLDEAQVARERDLAQRESANYCG